MQINVGNRDRIIRAITLASAVLAFGVPFHAQAAEPAKPMSLQNVMEKLGRDMQAVTGAISREDWALVARLAPIIAHHSEPPVAERVRIMAWLGKDAARFRGLDEQVHEAAAAMGEAATRSDGLGVCRALESSAANGSQQSIFHRLFDP